MNLHHQNFPLIKAMGMAPKQNLAGLDKNDCIPQDSRRRILDPLFSQQEGLN